MGLGLGLGFRPVAVCEDVLDDGRYRELQARYKGDLGEV